MLKEPLDPWVARRIIRGILASGQVGYSSHALEEMAKDRLTHDDVVNVLRGGLVEPPEFDRGTWRYRVRTNRIFVVIVFRSETELHVVTAWRVKKR